MSSKKPRIPAYRHHKGSGQAFVQIKGKRHYLGKHGSEESRERYKRIIAELCIVPTSRQLANKSAVTRASGHAVVELIRDYVEFAKEYYRESNELEHIKYALRPLKKLYGRTTISEFGPLRLKGIWSAAIEGRP